MPSRLTRGFADTSVGQVHYRAARPQGAVLVHDGHRHQRFILSMASGRTLLVAHNIDLAPRVASLNPGDVVAFKAVYEWNAKGGTIHWTHRDPNGRHPGGWLRHGGKTYQ